MRIIPHLLLVLALLLMAGQPGLYAQADPNSALFLPLVIQGELAEPPPETPEPTPTQEPSPTPETPEPTPTPITTPEPTPQPTPTHPVDPSRLEPDEAAPLQPEDVQTRPKPAPIAAAVASGGGGLQQASVIVVLDESIDAGQLAAQVGGAVIHRYERAFRGASLVVPEERLPILAEIQGVQALYLDKLVEPNTDTSPRFIGAPVAWQMLGGQGNAGEHVTIGVLDLGIWPEHPSFADPDPSGKPYSPPPVRPGANGFGDAPPRNTCDFGNVGANPDDAPFACNNKLIGAYTYLETYKTVIGLLPDEFDSARDDNGHGTHTASIAAGNAGVSASIFGLPFGTVSGVAPRAHIVAYRVCADQGCYQSDIIAAIEQAIRDKVDVINLSIGGGASPYRDPVELALLNAYEQGIFVAASAGNDGPQADTVEHRGPWVTTVGASSTDRAFVSTLLLVADNGDTLQLTGASVTPGILAPAPVVLADDPATPGEVGGRCSAAMGPVPAGAIVVCNRGSSARVLKSYHAANAGAAGMILRNLTPQGVNPDNHFIPTVHLEADAGEQLIQFLQSHSGVHATFTPGTRAAAQGDVVAPFSSRGGPQQTLGINKPDLVAPGVQILAGHTPLPATLLGGLPGQLFQVLQGTSMASPHVAGAAALLKAIHPEWTPGQIKSALMTTARTANVVLPDGTPATPFDRGAGRLNLGRAGDATLTIDAPADEFRTLANQLWNANYPSLFLPDMPGRITVQRRIANLTDKKRVWVLTVDAPPDVQVDIPKVIQIEPHSELLLPITVDASTVPLGEVRHANINFKRGREHHDFPITLVRGQPVVTLTAACTPNVLSRLERTDCTLTLTNRSFAEAHVAVVDRLPRQLTLLPETVEGANVDGNGISFGGILPPATPPQIGAVISPTASPAGYVPLAGFRGSVVVNATDESIANFNVPGFFYGGETYSRVGIVSNGYVVVGGGTADDVQHINSDFPDPAVPNNVLAPFWTDLNPEQGGRILINVLTDGADNWIVIEWENVPNYQSADERNTFQLWIGTAQDAHPEEDISFVYGPSITRGNRGNLTVGAENAFGNAGVTVYFNGTGTPPRPSYPHGDFEVAIVSQPGAPGGSHTIRFGAQAGHMPGNWTHCAEMTANLFQGTHIACVSGQVSH
ncbi:MAG: peptidase S8 [Litorilinea sp.]|nr:MAG: peptidase S8 [Litorilinea sp.]